MLCCLLQAASKVVQHILQQLLSEAPAPWPWLSPPAPRGNTSSLWALPTWSPRPAKESKGKGKSCPGANSGQTFHTFTGRTGAKGTQTHMDQQNIINFKISHSDSQFKHRCRGYVPPPVEELIHVWKKRWRWWGTFDKGVSKDCEVFRPAAPWLQPILPPTQSVRSWGFQ